MPWASKLALAALVPFALLAGCGSLTETTDAAPDGQTCTLIGCGGGPTVEARLQTTRQTLEGAKVTLCVDALCDDLLLSGQVPASGSNVDPNFGSLAGEHLHGVATLTDEGQGWLTLSLGEVWPAPEGATARYHLRIVDAADTVLLDVAREATFNVTYPNGPNCSPGCTSGTVSLYADSPSDMTCSSNACQAGFSWTGNIRWSAPGQSADVQVCRGDACARGSVRRGADFASRRNLEGAFTGAVETEGLTADATEVRLIAEAESRALADGDRYRVTITEHETGAVLATFDQAVDYDESYPNGAACDPHPCRTATVETP